MKVELFSNERRESVIVELGSVNPTLNYDGQQEKKRSTASKFILLLNFLLVQICILSIYFERTWFCRGLALVCVCVLLHTEIDRQKNFADRELSIYHLYIIKRILSYKFTWKCLIRYLLQV